LREFVKRDLSNPKVSSLSQIEWRKDVTDLTLKSRINGWLTSTEGRAELDALGFSKASQLFSTDELMTPQNFVERIIVNLNKDQVFISVFK
jgi:hypothetical protein